jgi:hypothetical protein
MLWTMITITSHPAADSATKDEAMTGTTLTNAKTSPVRDQGDP